MNSSRKKLIEVALPLEAINAAAAREKSIRHGHPSTLHLWWERRPLAVALQRIAAISLGCFHIEPLGRGRDVRLLLSQRFYWHLSYNHTILLYRGMPMTTADVIQTITDRIVRDFHPLRLILFGSHARGDARPESDIDLLVVLPQVTNKRLAAIAIRRALADLPVCKDIVVTTPEEITRRGDLIGTVLRPALREGKVLYERS